MGWAGACLVCVGLGQASQAEPPRALPANERQAEVVRMAQRAIQEQQFSFGNGGAELMVRGEPILRWSNPTAGEVYGDVFVWTDRGRPALVGSIYRWFQPDWGATLEVCSLTTEPLVGRHTEREFWHPTSAGVAWHAAADATTPAAGPAARLSQMKRLAGDVTATLVDTRNVAEPVSRALRLMPQPLFRYPAPENDADYVDGALFAFVEGTDPEVLMLVEAPRSSLAAWRYGFARMNRDELRVSIRGQPAWQVPYLPAAECLQNPRLHYSLFVVNRDTGRVQP